MRYFSLVKVRKDLKRWSPHVLSFDFLKTPPKIMESAGKDWETIKTLPFIRLDDNREILINTSSLTTESEEKMSVLDAILIFTAGAFCSYLHSYVKELEREDY